MTRKDILELSTKLQRSRWMPSTTSSPPVVGVRGDPVEAARTGGNEPDVSNVLPLMELMDMGTLTFRLQ